MEIEIRRARDDEHDRIYELRFQVFVLEPGPWNSATNNWTRELGKIPDPLDVETINLVAVSNGQIVGGRALVFTGGKVLSDRGDWGFDRLESEFGYEIRRPEQLGELRRLFVLPDWRKQGLGHLLNVAGEEELRRRGADVALAAIKVGNDPSVRLRTRHGWVLCGGVRGDPYNFDYYAKNLRASEVTA